MATMGPKFVAVFLLGAMGIFSSMLQPRGNQDVAQNSPPAVVRLDKVPLGIAYTVGSRRTGSTATTDILYALNQVKSERGSKAPVVVIVDPRVSITDIWNLDGIAGKAQLDNVRYFVINRESGVMSELKWGPTVPISTNPN